MISNLRKRSSSGKTGTNHPRMTTLYRQEKRRSFRSTHCREPGLIRLGTHKKYLGRSATARNSATYFASADQAISRLKGIMKEMLEEEEASWLGA